MSKLQELLPKQHNIKTVAIETIIDLLDKDKMSVSPKLGFMKILY